MNLYRQSMTESERRNTDTVRMWGGGLTYSVGLITVMECIQTLLEWKTGSE